MVQTDIGDDAEQGGDDVGRVEAAAHTHFDDGDVDLLVAEVVEGQSDSHLEEGEPLVFKELLVFFDEADHFVLGYHFAADADALAEVDEVGRGVETHFVAGLLQDGGEEVRHGAFAVGAGDVDGAEAALGMAEVVHHCLGVDEVGLIGCCTDAVVGRQSVEQIVKGFFVGHFFMR